jgi:hypothetical protein
MTLATAKQGLIGVFLGVAVARHERLLRGMTGRLRQQQRMAVQVEQWTLVGDPPDDALAPLPAIRAGVGANPPAQHRCFWGKGTSGRRQSPQNLVEVNPIYALAHCLPVRHQVTDGVV